MGVVEYCWFFGCVASLFTVVGSVDGADPSAVRCKPHKLNSPTLLGRLTHWLVTLERIT